MSARSKRPPVLSYFYLVVIVFTASAVAVFGLAVYSYAQESTAREDLDRYHVRTLTLAAEVSSRIGVAREIVSGTIPGDDAAFSTAEREFVSAILAARSGIEEIVALQSDVGEAAFAGTVDRAAQRAEAMATAALAQSWTPTRWESELAAMDLTAFQLSRLHSTTIEDELAALSQRTNRLRIAAITLAVIVIVASGLLVVRVVRLVRARLQDLDDATSELLETQQRLQQSQRLESLATLVGGVAHDFNNVLLTILGRAELVMADLDPTDRNYDSLLAIQKAGERAAAMTRQLLAFSRQEPGERQPTDLNLVIRDLEPMVRELLRDDVEVVISEGGATGLVSVDPVQMERVVLNLVMNARDAMPAGGSLSIDVSAVDGVTLADQERTGSFIRLRVEDTGSGMAPEVVNRAFEPFFSTKADSLGTGLGLSVVHGIVTNGGGVIDVASRPGCGTRFDIYLPSIASDLIALDEPVPDLVAGGPETIMLVEDDARIRELIDAALRNAGYDVVATDDSHAALETFQHRHDEIGLVISDVVMPGLRGPDLVERLRRIRPDVAVVFISGYGSQEVLDSVRASGHPLIYKPFKLRELLEIVRRELDREPA